METVDIKLNITTPSGKEVFRDIAVLYISDISYIQFRVLSYRVIGDIKIVLNGEAVLKSEYKTYVIKMPCLLSVGIPCYRIQMLIPGYDMPMKIAAGSYNITLVFSWRASGRGEFNLKLGIVRGSETAMIIPIGDRPSGSTSKWIYAKGSTKSYALLIDKSIVGAIDGYGSIKAWAWLFKPNGDTTLIFKFRLINACTGGIITESDIPVEKHGVYYQILVLIRAKPGRYILEVILPIGVKLNTPITVISSSR